MPDPLTINLLMAGLGAVMVAFEAWAKRKGHTRRDWTPFWLAGSVMFLLFALFAPGGLVSRYA